VRRSTTASSHSTRSLGSSPSPKRPTGIVCGNDEIALQVYCAAFRLGTQHSPRCPRSSAFDDFQAVSNVIEPKTLDNGPSLLRNGCKLAVETLTDMMHGVMPEGNGRGPATLAGFIKPSVRLTTGGLKGWRRGRISSPGSPLTFIIIALGHSPRIFRCAHHRSRRLPQAPLRKRMVRYRSSLAQLFCTRPYVQPQRKRPAPSTPDLTPHRVRHENSPSKDRPQ